LKTATVISLSVHCRTRYVSSFCRTLNIFQFAILSLDKYLSFETNTTVFKHVRTFIRHIKRYSLTQHFWMSVTSWCSVCKGHFVMVPLNLTCVHSLQHFSLNISSIYIIIRQPLRCLSTCTPSSSKPNASIELYIPNIRPIEPPFSYRPFHLFYFSNRYVHFPVFYLPPT